MGEFIHLPTYNQVLSICNVSHVINFTRFPLSFRFFVHMRGEPGTEARKCKATNSLSYYPSLVHCLYIDIHNLVRIEHVTIVIDHW